MVNIYYLEKNDIPFYIGKTKHHVNKRLNQHRRKYGLDITIHCLDIVGDTKIEWKFWECYWIQQFKVWGFELVNQNNGGGGPEFQTEESNLKRSKATLGKVKHNDASKKAIRDKALGRIKSDEWKRKIGLGNKGNHKKLGVKISQEAKDKIRDKLIGRSITWENGRKPGFIQSEETKDKISKAKLGKPNPKTDEWIKKLNKAVIQYDLNMNIIKRWDSIKEASIDLKIQASDITACCRGKQKTTNKRKFKWKYEN